LEVYEVDGLMIQDILSYNTTIGRHVVLDNLTRVSLLDVSWYSVTTNRHQGYLNPVQPKRWHTEVLRLPYIRGIAPGVPGGVFTSLGRGMYRWWINDAREQVWKDRNSVFGVEGARPILENMAKAVRLYDGGGVVSRMIEEPPDVVRWFLGEVDRFGGDPPYRVMELVQKDLL